MKLYRIEQALPGTSAASAFSGEAAARFPKRWNNDGVCAVYCSDSLAGSCLEILAHLPNDCTDFPDSVYFELEVADRLLETPPVSALPEGWNAREVSAPVRDFGTRFLHARRAVGLVVPTVLIPVGWNVVLNPFHPAFPHDAIRGPVPFRYDRRVTAA